MASFVWLRRVVFLICMAAVLSVHAGWSAESDGHGGSLYALQVLPTEKPELGSLGLSDCQPGIRIKEDLLLAPCRDRGKDRGTVDYGIRVALIDVSSPRPEVIYESKGFGDAYYVKISVFSGDDAGKPLVVLAEAGAEFSYGTSVYLLKDRRMKPIGFIGETVDEGGSPSSVVPHLAIADRGGSLIFRFIKDVVVPRKDGKYKSTPKDRVEYLYDGKKFRRRLR